MVSRNSNASDNRRRIDDALLQWTEDNCLFVAGAVSAAIDNEAWSLSRLGAENYGNVSSIDSIGTSRDPSLHLATVLSAWDAVFANILTQHGVSRQLVDKIRHIRNDYAHNLQDYNNIAYVNDALRAIADFTRGFENARASLGSQQSEQRNQGAPVSNPATSDAAAYYNQGVAFFNNGHYDLAIANFNRAIQLNRNYALALNDRGAAYSWKGQHDRAIEDYNRAIAIDPNNALYWRNRGISHSAIGRHGQAISDHTSALAINPNDADTWHNRGWEYQQMGQFDQATTDYNSALGINQFASGTLNNLGLMYLSRKKYSQAIEYFDRALSINPHEVLAINNKKVARRGKLWRRVRWASVISASCIIALVILANR